MTVGKIKDIILNLDDNTPVKADGFNAFEESFITCLINFHMENNVLFIDLEEE